MLTPLEGPIVIGTTVDAIMLGCAIVQSCVYFKNSRGEEWSLKALVSLFLFLLFSHLSCATAWLWASAEVKFGDSVVPGYAAIVLGISNVLGAVILFLERCFFSYRILRSSNNHFLAFLFFLSCAFSFTASLGAASLFFSGETTELRSWIFALSLISGLFCDIPITIAITLYLRSQTPTETADSMGHLARLPLVVAETSCVASLLDIAIVLVYWLAKSNPAWVGLLVAMPGVFVNTLLATLNIGGQLCADIRHQRSLNIGDSLIDKQTKRPPIVVSISGLTEKRYDPNPV